jgi:hypothetical protein
MIKRLIALAVLAASFPAAAQLRTIPQDAKRAQISHLQEMIMEVDGKRARLAPGAQIRDANNFVVLPTAVPPGSLAKYRVNAEGMLSQVWILSPQEAAQPDRTR